MGHLAECLAHSSYSRNTSLHSLVACGDLVPVMVPDHHKGGAEVLHQFHWAGVSRAVLPPEALGESPPPVSVSF